MSIKMMFSAMQIETGNPVTKIVLLKLADNANDKGECWPSYENIAKVCEISKRTAMRHIDKLIEMGFLTKQKRKGEKGNTSNLYNLSLDGVRVSPPSDTESLPPSDTESPDPVSSLEPVNQNVGSSTQPAQNTSQLRKKAFEHFWLTWRQAKKMAGTTNDAPKGHSETKFNLLFPVSMIEKKGAEWFRYEINQMCDFCNYVHIEIAEARENNRRSAFDRFERMMPEKYFTQKQWRDFNCEVAV